MKFNYLIKATPLLSTFLLIIILSVCNQKEYTKIRLLIWNTPSLTIGNYLALSTVSGFTLSYFISSRIGKIILTTQKPNIGVKDEADDNKYKESLEEKKSEINSYHSYQNTLIERDIKDPSPTIDASFRVIGRTEKSMFNYKTSDNAYTQYEDSFEIEEDLDELSVMNKTSNQPTPSKSDWDHENYLIW